MNIWFPAATQLPARLSSLRRRLVLATFGGVMIAASSASTAQTAWIYLKRDAKAFVETLPVDAILSGNIRSGEWVGVIKPIDRATLMGYGPAVPPAMDHQAIES